MSKLILKFAKWLYKNLDKFYISEDEDDAKELKKLIDEIEMKIAEKEE